VIGGGSVKPYNKSGFPVQDSRPIERRGEVCSCTVIARRGRQSDHEQGGLCSLAGGVGAGQGERVKSSRGAQERTSGATGHDDDEERAGGGDHQWGETDARERGASKERRGGRHGGETVGGGGGPEESIIGHRGRLHRWKTVLARPHAALLYWGAREPEPGPRR
jgi:hypothetical protein